MAAATAHIGTASGVAGVIGMDTVIGKSTPDCNQNRSNYYRANQGHACNSWLTSNGEVENAVYQEDGDEADNDSA